VQLSYFGKSFHGWQIQPNAISVQETLNQVFSTLLNTDIYFVGAGRTDTGVHAKEMWAHFEYGGELEENLVNRANRFLKEDIAIYHIVAVDERAHTRFDAISREYEYHIALRKNPFESDFSWYLHKRPDVESMMKATEVLFQFHDFTSFSRSNTQTKTNLCKIMKAQWEEKDHKLIFTIKADRFLRNMVRAIVGTLVQIGQGKRSVESFSEIIEAKDRTLAGESAPAKGLFLTKVEYPKNILNV
jgi:tRNA pseudouridine38-40 synthase